MRQAICVPFLAVGLVLLPACAVRTELTPIATEWKQEDFRWTYKGSAESGHSGGPMALYGPPETLASLAFVCERQERALDFLEYESDPFVGERPIAIEAGEARWRGVEVTEPPDGPVIVRARIPLGHAIVSAIERGDTSIRVAGETGTASAIPNDPAIGRVIRECRALRRPE